MIRLRKPPCPDTFTITPVSPVFNSDSFISSVIQNSKFIIHNYDYYYLLYLLLQATCLLVYSFTRQLNYILTNKGNEKKQNRKCLYRKYLIMGIGNGKKKGYNRYFSSCNNNNTLARGMR